MSDAAPLFDDICFEAALALAGQPFVLTEQAQLDALYTRIDDSRRCARPIARQTFDFSGGRAVVGTWTYAQRGCTAGHDLIQMFRDDSARTMTLHYQFHVEGDCPYELLRPLWVTVEQVGGYALTLDVQR